MVFVHPEYLVRRRYAELVPVGEEQRLYAVDQLRGVGHYDLVGMPMEGVEGEARDQRIAHGGHASEKVMRRYGGGVRVPGSPFVHHQFHAVLAVELAHHVPMPRDQILHAVGPFQVFVRVFPSEIEGIAFAGPAAVIMQRPSPDAVQQPWVLLAHAAEEAARPLVVGTVRPGGDVGEWTAVSGNPGGEFAKLDGV